MAKRTSTFQCMPRTGGLNTTLDEGVLPPGTLTRADNVIFDFQASIRRREGVNFDWDSLTPDPGNAVVGGIDYWVGTVDSKAQYLISVRSDGTVYRTQSGVSTLIPDGGVPWTTPLTEANMEVFNNRVIIAVSGVDNRMKYWDGNPANPLRDLPANSYVGTAETLSVSRASAGTTRTLVLNQALGAEFQNGDDIIITSDNPAYAGSYTLASGAGTTTITYVAATPLTEATTTDTTITIGQVAPLALFVREHLGSLWTNDKTNLDRVHFSGAANHTAWLGYGGSGAIDIGVGDGDPAGITGLSPTYKGDMFVGKRTKLYRLFGQEPDTLQVIKVSTGIGFLSHQAITAIDQDDLFFVSYRGIHSMNATNAYGDFTAAYISSDIQHSFVREWNEGRKRYIKASYLPELNSAAFAVSERGQPLNNALWLYNVQLKYWYRWPGVAAESLIAAQDTDRRRLYLGTSSGRLAQTLTLANQDTLEGGATAAINLNVATGIIYPDQRPDTVKGFKRLMVVYKSQGSYTISARIKIDNFSEQALAFVSNEQAVPLGEFILGQDVLGGSLVTAPYSMPVDGYGRGFKLFLQQSDYNTAMAIQGFMVEFEGNTWDQPETRRSDNEGDA